jgi:aspartyl-tRNA(Asn)/glutamyl-tRNA(Gln) amidotransferase subunit C
VRWTDTGSPAQENDVALSTDDVRHVARLARIALTDDEIEALREDLSEILSYAEKVGEVATADVPPTGHAYPLSNVLREDEPRDSLPPQVAVSTAPEAEDGRFRVPRIVEEEA